MSLISQLQRQCYHLWFGFICIILLCSNCGGTPDNHSDAGEKIIQPDVSNLRDDPAIEQSGLEFIAEQKQNETIPEQTILEVLPSESIPEEVNEPLPEKHIPKEYDLSEVLRPGEVRAGVIREQREIIGGLKSYEEIGDIKIYNDKVAFTIEGIRRSHGYITYGGGIAAADIIREQGKPGQSLFGELAFGFNHQTISPKSYEIVNDGSNGKSAIVRMRGSTKPLYLLLSYMQAYLPSFSFVTEDMDCDLIYEYELAPNSKILTIRVTISNNTSKDIEINFAEIGMFMGDGLETYFPNKGFIDGKETSGAWPYLGFSNAMIGYVLFPDPEHPFQLLIKYKNVIASLHSGFSLFKGEEMTITWHLATAANLADAQAAYRHTLAKHTYGHIIGKVTENSTDKPLPYVAIHIEQKAPNNTIDYIGQAFSREDGTYKIELPPGDYQLLTYRENGSLSTLIPVTVKTNAQSEYDLKAEDMGELAVKVTDKDSGQALPVKVIALPSKRISVPARYAPTVYGAGAASIFFPHTGEGSTFLPLGSYRVVISRGFFYDLHEEQVDIKVGERTFVTAQLQKVVQTAGILSGDFHLHATGSPDSEDTDKHKVAAIAGEGLELAVSSDHEFLTDYEPIIASMGLSKWMYGIVGEEITTHFGHFNALPLTYDPSKSSFGAIWWYDLKAPRLFDLVYDTNPDAIIQINHPRGLPAGAYFSYVDYDPATDTAKNKQKASEWSTRFDAIEVINGKNFAGNWKEVSPDWMGMLNHGRRITATGNSDSHRATTSECGYPRNLVIMGTDDPRSIKPVDLSNAIKAGRVIVSGGAIIHFSISPNGDPQKASGLGELVSLSDDTAHLHIRVEAAPWISLNHIEIIANAKSIWQQDLSASETSIVRFNDTIPLKPERDTWYIILVRGSKQLTPVVSGAIPFAFTNPIYVDANKNQKFDPPASQN
jgi:hypothetical protein